MKIIYIITKADEIGGAQAHVRDLACEAKKNGHEVKVIVGEDGLFVKQLKRLDVDVIILNSLIRSIKISKDIMAILKLAKLLKKEKPDIVALHSSKAGVIGRIACKLTRTPCVFTVHGWSFADGIDERARRIYIRIERMLAKITHKIITVSIEDKELAVKNNVASPNMQIVIHNGISDIDVKLSEQNCECEKKTLRMVMVARFSKQKDHETLFNALKILKNKNWHLDLIGKGELYNKYNDMAKEFNIIDKITFVGEVDNVDEFLKKSDIFLLISNWEGFPISILEAMRAGIPIIASNVGGVAEAITDKNNGFLIERKDVLHLKDRIDELLSDAGKRNNFAMNGYRKFKNEFTLETMYNKTFEVYESVHELYGVKK